MVYHGEFGGASLVHFPCRKSRRIFPGQTFFFPPKKAQDDRPGGGALSMQKKNFGLFGHFFWQKLGTWVLLSSMRLTKKNPSSRSTLALRGLEEPAHASRGLEEFFLQLCFCVSFWFWREIGFGFTYYLCT